MNLVAHDFAITNLLFESSLAVPRVDFEDDSYGVMAPLFAEMGKVAAEHPDKLIFDLLANGFTGLCYDGQPFFDADHPVGDEADGGAVSVSNTQAGAEDPWFLLDTSRAVKPMVYQERIPYRLTRLDEDRDENVFKNDEFVYGLRGRSNAGYGLWQLAFGSKDTLNAANYASARAAMMAFKGDGGRPLGVKPTTLVVPPSLESAALKLLNSELASGGETNEWKGTAKLIVTPWLA
jgi:phage major head subunit gpT-like protein